MSETAPATPSAPRPSHSASPTANGLDPHTSPRGRGRGRGRGPRGNRGNRGRGRGQGLSGDVDVAARPFQSDTAADPSYGRPPGGSFGVRLTEAASIPQGDSRALPSNGLIDQEAADEQEVCFICASPIDHVSIAPCNHQTCHICALRLRALYKTRACAHCRVSLFSSAIMFSH